MMRAEYRAASKGLLCKSEHENSNAKMGRTAAAKVAGVHLEAMETAENTREEPDEAWNAPVPNYWRKPYPATGVPF